MTKETDDGRIDEFLDNHPLMTIALMTLLVFLAGLSMATGMPPVEDSEYNISYSEESVNFTLESEGPVIVDEIKLYIDNYAVEYDVQGDTLNYVHGSEWDGEEVRLVWKHNTPEEEVLYEGTAPEK